jgi:hypothetical protein
MTRTLFIVLCTVLMSTSTFAATLVSVTGKVLINRGDGFQQATSGIEAKAGDRLMADAGGSAKLVYPGGCQVKVTPGKVVSVGKQLPCTAPSLVGETTTTEGYFRNPVVPFAITAAIGWGIFCATVYCRDEGGRGRRFTQPGFGQPASP